jgi:hypothetical protein
MTTPLPVAPRPHPAGGHSSRFSQRGRSAICGLVSALTFAAAPSAAQTRNPCDVITKAEAEALVGGPLIGPQLSPQGTLCKYYESGYGESPSRTRLVTIGVWVDDRPDDEAVNTRRLAVTRDSSLLPIAVKELAAPGDAAIWVWAGNRLGALYAFRGGTTEVAVKISGTTQAAALAAAKRFAIRALGGAGRSTFLYAQRQLPFEYKEYYAPRLLGALYLGTMSQIPDDPMTRNYVWSLARAFNGLCPGVPEPLALVEYGLYNEVKGQKDMFRSAWAGNAVKMFRDLEGMMRRVRPHMLEIGEADARQFILTQEIAADPSSDPFDPDPSDCLTPQIEHLYDNLAALVRRRHTIPPDVADDNSFLAQLRPDAQKQFGFDPRAPRVVTPAQAMKTGCSEHTAAAAAQGEATAMEVYCRCVVDAAVVGGLPETEMRALGASFDNATLTRAADRYPKFAVYRRDCLH